MFVTMKVRGLVTVVALRDILARAIVGERSAFRSRKQSFVSVNRSGGYIVLDD